MLEPDAGCPTLDAADGRSVFLPQDRDDLLVECSGVIGLDKNTVVVGSAALYKSPLEINVGRHGRWLG